MKIQNKSKARQTAAHDLLRQLGPLGVQSALPIRYAKVTSSSGTYGFTFQVDCVDCGPSRGSILPPAELASRPAWAAPTYSLCTAGARIRNWNPQARPALPLAAAAAPFRVL